MRLTHLKLAGFKSFVDPTTISTPGQLVGVVGPNGCGKSNVIDAVRWVLGESKASALRGETMQDVIFNGSGGRKPVGRASVELIFDNSLGKAVGQWSQYGEIAIKRVLTRAGESSYYINNQHVRRRDITDLFLGTGLGVRAYAIIEQGMISRIIEARPEELRVFLEEAAGVSKYKERRRETENRLADTKENLLRVDDIFQELVQQLARLETQAQVATQYHEMQAELQTAQHMLWLVKKNEAATQREKFERDLQRVGNDLEAATAQLRDAEKRIEAIRADHVAASEVVHTAQGAFYAANAEVSRLEQQIQHLRDNRQRLENQLASLHNQEAELEKQRLTSAQQLVHWQGEQQRAAELERNTRERVEIEAAKLPVVDQGFRDCEQRVSEVQGQLAQIEQAFQVEETHRNHAVKILEQLGLRHSRLLLEKDNLPKADSSRVDTLQAQQQQVSTDLTAKQTELTALQTKLPELETGHTNLQQQVQTLRHEITQREARRNALQQLQEKLENNQAQKTWLEKNQLNGLPRLWQSLKVEAGWDDAIESVLRERLNAVVLGNVELARPWLEAGPPAKLAVLAPQTDVAIANAPPGRVALLSLVRCKDAQLSIVLNDWLYGVYCVENAEQAFTERNNLAPGEMLVTKQGHLLTRGGINFYAPESELHGVLARSREIESLAAELIEREQRFSDDKNKLDAADAELRQCRQTLSTLRSEVSTLQQRQHQLQIEHLKVSEAIQRTAHRDQQITDELNEINTHEASENAQKQQALTKLGEYQHQLQNLREQLDVARRERAVVEGKLNQQRSMLQTAERAAQEAVFFEKTCTNKIEELHNTAAVFDKQQMQIKTSLETLAQELANIAEAPVQELLQTVLVTQQDKEKALAAARDALEGLNNTLREIEQERLIAEQKLHPLRDKIQETKLKEQEARINEAQYEQHLSEAGANLDELVAKLDKGTRPNVFQGQIERLNREIEALGAVNLAALEELKSSQERKNYLESQATDLREAVATLEAAIQRIDRESRALLQETFDTVNRHFGELFPALFGGGQAKLVLTGEEILDSGVQVTAQPPGKKNSSIHLLSGGEKALTALSLVFSLFQLNPAPFCLLDEVDAPLDDSNTERFCALVKKMAQHTQFLFVSHNKITMEMAQQLIGVTMQESGVSRIVAVDIDEALRLRDEATV